MYLIYRWLNTLPSFCYDESIEVLRVSRIQNIYDEDIVRYIIGQYNCLYGVELSVVLALFSTQEPNRRTVFP